MRCRPASLRSSRLDSATIIRPAPTKLTLSVTKPLHIALIGCGNVGSAVAKMLLDAPQRLTERARRPINVRRVVVRDLARLRPVSFPPGVLSAQLEHVLSDPEIDVAVELVGGVEWARSAVLDLLKAGKHVVTANKALLAMHGAEIFATAHRHNRSVAFEASVGGGIPIVGAVTQGLAANQIVSLQGILNGTSNYILTEMSEAGRSYSGALAEAQRRGYAEADPKLDVDGTDVAHKLAILARLAFGVAAPLESIARRGIADLDEMDIRFARELGYTIKLLAEAWLSALPSEPRSLALHVSPVLLRQTTPLAQVRGAYNAISVVGDAVGDTLYYGRGAGALPTASAVVADLIDLATGRAQLAFQSLRLWETTGDGVQISPSGAVRSRFYLRLLVADRPGVLADVARILARHEISISSVIQHEALDEREGECVPIVIMTHTAATGAFVAAAREIDQCEGVAAPGVYYPVAD